MKKILALILPAVLCLSLFPSLSYAAPPDKDLNAFLAQNGWTKTQLNSYLEYYFNEELDSFDTVDEIKTQLGDPITDENLAQLLKNYHFKSEDDLKSFLIENDELQKNENLRDKFKFINTLDQTVSFYSGTPIDDKNLQNLLNQYGMTKDELEVLLKENGDSLDNYKYIEDLDDAIKSYTQGLDFSGLFSQFGLTNQEIEKLIGHFMTLNVKDPSFDQKITDIGDRLSSMKDFNSKSDLTPSQINNLVESYNELLSLLQLDVKYYLVKKGEKTPVTEQQLINMKSTNGRDLLIEIYDTNHQFLADIVLTKDMFGSEIIKTTANKIVKTEKKVIKQPSTRKPVARTISGGKLPNTAGHYADHILLGSVLLILGLLLFRKWKVMKA
ncbi:processed acidic surface protein [Heyndrickxia acidicola]|uniref:Processed acidic surface protein n=1 Tax=Heyndrickxia acidicola TaxID=209389 RepID=A0ABU6MFS9_9BACI|nr:processed acidic surface protein [Heyndrickxia acidicola]MED1203129.1 processed acidic surface protein [Heyndrickxia acidicola]